MKTFNQREITEVVLYAKAGGQALHLHHVITPDAPACFKRDVANGCNIAHLFDLDEIRLKKTARKLGVRIIQIDRRGTDKQHIDLCGKPLTNCWAMGLLDKDDIGDKCEGCGRPAVCFDPDGVPLCEKCAEAATEDQNPKLGDPKD